MFDVGLGELLALGVVALLVFGPDRLPAIAADAGKWLRELRGMSTRARKELSDAVGPDVADLALNPRDSVTRILNPITEEATDAKRTVKDAARFDEDAT